MRDWGCFPFGQPNSVRPARFAEASEAMVVGVYPSAWHVAWQAPAASTGSRRRGVRALAVDVEPEVFWDGKADDFAERVARWKKAVGFIDGKHGTIGATPPSTNGSSGRKVVEHYLRPLGISEERTSFTDICPVFFVKSGRSGRKREQGDAIREEYDAVATSMGMPLCSLPERPSKGELPALASEVFAGRLVYDLSRAGAPLVITLGEEVWDAMLRIPALRTTAPRARFADLYGADYGSTGRLTVNGRAVTWLPLVHPGLLPSSLRDSDFLAPDARSRSVAGWRALHSRWAFNAKDKRSG